VSEIPPPKPTRPGERLERAIEALLATDAATPDATERLLREHDDLRDLLEPMMGRGHDSHDSIASGQALEVGGAGHGAADGEATDGLGVGESVLGDYRLIREIGRGGMGVVYEAWQRSLDRRVAVKVLAPGFVSSPTAVARFRREAAAAARLRHPNIVEVHGFGSEDGRHFFAMQFVEGQPLHTCMPRFGEPGRAVALVLQLAEALAHAHAHGLVHRDVKPANILVRADDSVALTDFGVASDEAMPTLTAEGGFLGTLDYASPEQIRGERIDARTDVWALGVLMHELLAGQHPFRASSQEALMSRILTQEPSPPLPLSVPRDLAAIVGQALEKARSRRYASATALLIDLRAFLQGAPVSARLPNTVERVVRWARREPWRATTAIVLLVGLPLLAGTGGYLWANAPRIAAARTAERTLERENLLARAWWHYYEDDFAGGIETIRGSVWRDEPEARITMALLAMRAGDYPRARDFAAGIENAAGALTRQALGATGEAPPPAQRDDDFAAFVRATILLDEAIQRQAWNPDDRTKADAALRAIVLAPNPRLPYLVTYAGIAAKGDDRGMATTAELALHRHYPDNAVATRMRARLLVRWEPAEALRLLDHERADVGALRGASLWRGVALEALKRLDEALEADRAAVAELPDSSRAHANLGIVLRKLQRYDESEQMLRRAVQLAPRDPFAQNALALTLRAAGKTEAARATWQALLERTPHYSAAAYNLGNLHKASGDLAAAAAAYEQATKGDAVDARMLANLGDVLVRLERVDEALPHLLRAAELAPGDLIPHYNIARAAVLLKLPAIALSAGRRAAAIDQKGPHGLLALADALLAQREVDAPAALAAARTAVERAAADHADPRLLLARAQAANGDRAAALATLDAMLADAAFAKRRDEIEALRRTIAGQ
jgi:tetratricopeptide (TPR) repeat protein